MTDGRTNVIANFPLLFTKNVGIRWIDVQMDGPTEEISISP